VRLALSGYGLDLESPQGITLYYGAMPVRHQGDRSTSATSCKQTIAADLHLSSDTFLVLGCGTVTLRKGCDVFVQVANHLVNCLGHRDVAFIWIGFSPDPHYLDWLQYDIHLAGLADHVFFAGQRDNPEDYLRGCDVFALTSREDPFPLVNLEAMYYGRPVVSFQGAGGAPEIHTHGRGMPVGYLNIVEMAEAIAHLKQNSDLAHQIGTTGQQYVQQELTWEKLVNQVLGILEADFGYASPARHLVRP
jgi:glycosyltransferase involved in cell wall biosynthesis